MKQVKEVRSDHIDDDNICHIDVYYSEDENEQGKTVAFVDLDTGKVIYVDNIFRLNDLVSEEITYVLNENYLSNVLSTILQDISLINKLPITGFKVGVEYAHILKENRVYVTDSEGKRLFSCSYK